ncbi:MAG TPA: SRPBCC family protein [Marmoricola sp.]|nr:SRPBCC family protein [Marmoricola sp.]HNI69709.1 SRPBCC family protein [Marmoricola sp.]HNN47403.1 SRPBCC family protein [Marmoricola sp.]
MSRTITYRFIRISTAPPETLFDLVANGDQWKHWAGPMVLSSNFSYLGPDQDAGVGAIRALGPGFTAARERTTIHERPHRYGYEMARDRAPLKGYRSLVEFEPHAAGTLVTWSGSFQESFRGNGRLVMLVFKPLMQDFLRRLVTYADNLAERSSN